MPTILTLLFRRMMENKTPQYTRLFVHSVLHIAGKFGGQYLFGACDSIQPGMTTLIVTKVIEPHIEALSNAGRNKSSRIVVGATKLLCESNVRLDPSTWSILVQSTIALLIAVEAAPVKETTFFEEEDAAESREFDGSFSKLAYAHIPEIALSAEASQASAYFATSLAGLCRTSPGQYSTLLSTCLNQETGGYLQNLLQQSGLSLV
jgi:hypothetical protein